MQNTTNQYDRFFEPMKAELSQIKEEAGNFHLEAERGIFIVQRYLQEVKKEVLKKGFSSKEDEIYFFKYTKPKFYSKLIFFQKVLYIIYNKPVGSKKRIGKFLNKQQAKLSYFYKKFAYLYSYCRSEDTSMDVNYFTRNNQHLLPGVEFYGVDTDPFFTTGYDFLVAKMKANELLQQYLEKEQQHLQSSFTASGASSLNKPIVWTASKAALIELIYGLQSFGAINNGTIALNEIAQFFETLFGIKLGNYYRIFQEIRIRKKSRTQFLDELKDRLIQKMDYWDTNPHANK